MASSSSVDGIASAGERLRQSIPKVLSDWESRLRQEILSAEHQKSAALIQHIPGFLERLAAELLAGPNSSILTASTSRQKGKEEAQEQGTKRANISRYVLHEVILEYHILREVIFKVLEEQSPLLPIERDIILNSIDRSVNDTASQFVKSVQSFQEIFLLGLVHDLRGPAINISTAAKLIMSDSRGDFEGIQKLAAIIDNSASRIDRMSIDLLDASKAQAGGVISLHFSDFELVGQLEGIIKSMKNTRVSIQAPSSHVLVRWSPNAFNRIIENLVGNALKFANSDSPITIRLEETTDAVTIAVHNQGPPIPHETRAKLFDKFSRGSEQHSKQGWGIGLVLVKGLVDAHHGTIEIESEENKGTTFVVRLPKQVPVEIVPTKIS